ncbi:uncharacterized protein [Engystomops pustulosus]|uniref:uncharacterized protein n=1 Tax=Engystomops pustulosus TaxID=76066 RepID=UPI003AFA48BC
MDVESLYTNIIHETEVDFLDLRITTRDGHIETTLYRKETATNNLLHYSSFHPQHLRDGIPIGQFLRLRRNCSSQEEFQRHCTDLTNRFRKRAYPRKVISRAYMRAKHTKREDTFTPSTRKSDGKPCLTTPYHNQWSDIYKLLQKNWGILRSDPRLHPHITAKPRMIAKRARNLRDSLVQSHFQRPSQALGRGIQLTGSYPCGDCTVCPMILRGDSFQNPTNQEKITLRSYINCRSRGVIYGLICSCPKIYVGQTTQELRKRVQKHVSTINNAAQDLANGRQLSTVAKHFYAVHGNNPSKLKVVGLEKIQSNIRGGDPVPALLRQEARWIFRLGSLSPKGINEDMLFSGFYKQ